MDVYVNETRKPVALILSAYEPTIWQIRKTKDTQIFAVYVDGYHKQFVAGLSEQTPILKNKDKYNCPSISYITEKNLSYINPVSQKLFKQDVNMVYFSHNGMLNIDNSTHPQDDSSFIQERAVPSESFRLPNTPLAKEAGLEEAVRNGIIRPATNQDFQRIFEQRNAGLPPTKNNSDNSYRNGLMAHNSYVILKPFKIPSGLYGAHSATFILEVGVPRPTGELGHSSLYDLNLKSCSGAVCQHQGN